jgi:hypothetical protein
LSFDGPNKIISLSSGTTSLDVKDLWSRWFDWFVTSDNSKFLIAMLQVGGNDIDIVDGTKIPIYIYLASGWKIRPQEANHTLKVTGGILLVDGGGDPFVNTVGAYTVRINYQQPVQAITVATGGSGVDPADIEAIRKLLEADKVFVAAGGGPGLLHTYERGTSTPLIPAKSVAGTSQTTSASIEE